MVGNNYDIDFENMDWSHSKSMSSDVDREYSSLWEELNEKCKPSKFYDPDNPNEAKRKMSVANEIFAIVQQHRRATDDELRVYRDRAIDELNVVFSTRRLLKYLNEFCAVDIYENMTPYDQHRVGEAIEINRLINESRNDIRRLEKVAKMAEPFIKMRKNELRAIEEAKLEEEREYARKQRLRKREEEEEGESAELRLSIIISLSFIFFAIIIGFYFTK